MRPRRLLGLAALTSLSLLASLSHADVELRDFVQGLARAQARGVGAGPVELPSALTTPTGVSVVIELPPGAAEPALPFVRIADRFVTLAAPEAEILKLLEAHPDWRLSVGAPRRPLMDKADTWIHAGAFREQTGNAGNGVLIGIIDTGIDPSHGDLRNADGTTRIRWAIDFSRLPEGLHAELESEYGCDQEDSGCAIFDNADLDALLANSTDGDEPRDIFGHGTHVASLAAGNGRSQPNAYYNGVAPEAQLIAARVSRGSGGSIRDADILKAARFVFDRAADLGMPAVVNLSLGSDFGAHDGSSTLEQALAAMVGPEQPGRAIVVAAGNSAGLSGAIANYPGPLGVHTEVHVPHSSPTRVPLVTTSEGATNGDATIYVWIGFQEDDDVAVALDDKDGEWIPLIAPGEATTFNRGAYKATIYNGSKQESALIPEGSNSAALVIEGTWPANREFSIRLEGHGTASLWVQSEAGLDPESLATAVFPRAEKQGTINIPGSHPELIAVGATLNRKLWIDHRNFPNEIKSHGSLDDPPNDTPANFSSAGPNALGLMKPDIIAPGAYVIGAMSKLADPRTNGHEGMFASQGRCGDVESVECYVVDDYHAVSTGTSMAAPFVSGAVALLFERDPTLTQDGVRALLQAGARQPTGIVLHEQQVGPGALDLEGALAAQISESSPINRVPGAASWLALATSYAHPDPNWPLVGLVELRDDAALIADGFDSRRLALEATPAIVLEPLTRIAPGLWRFKVAGPKGSGGEVMQLEVRFDGAVLLERTVPIGVDRWAAEERASARGGCGLSPAREQSSGPYAILLGLLALFGVRARGRARPVR